MRFCTICRRTAEGEADTCQHDGAATGPTTPVTPGPGQKIKDRFTLETVTARGLTGTLYKAMDVQTGGPVLLKIIHPTLEAAAPVKQRLKREMLQSQKLKTGQAAQTVDFGEDGHLLFLARTWIEGEPLSSFLHRNRKLSVQAACQIAYQICGGLDAAHKLGLIHRDLKPGHVLIAQSESSQNVMLIDFGIAPPIDGVEGIKDLCGTAEYISPEQAEGKMVSFRSDFYALGILLYQMITGRVPFADEPPASIIEKHRTVDPEPLSKVDPTVPALLSDLVAKLLSKKPATRPFSASMIQRELLKAVPEASQPLKLDLSRPMPSSQPGPGRVSEDLSMAKTAYGIASTPGIPAPMVSATQETEPLVQAPPVSAPGPAASAPSGVQKTVYGMPAMSASGAAPAPDAAEAHPSGVVQAPPVMGSGATAAMDTKRTVLGMPAVSPGQFMPAKQAQPAAEPAKTEASPKVDTEEPASKPEPAKRPERTEAASEPDQAETSAKKMVFIGLAIGAAIVVIATVVILLL